MRKYDGILLVEWTPNYALDKCAAWKVKFTLSFEPTLHFPPLTTRPRNLDPRKGVEAGGCVRRSRSQLRPRATFLAAYTFLPRDTRDAAARISSYLSVHLHQPSG